MNKIYRMFLLTIIILTMGVTFPACGENGNIAGLVLKSGVKSILGDKEGAIKEIETHAYQLATTYLEPAIIEVEKEVDPNIAVNIFQHRRDEILPLALNKFLNDNLFPDLHGKERAKQSIILAVNELSNNNG